MIEVTKEFLESNCEPITIDVSQRGVLCTTGQVMFFVSNFQRNEVTVYDTITGNHFTETVNMTRNGNFIADSSKLYYTNGRKVMSLSVEGVNTEFSRRKGPSSVLIGVRDGYFLFVRDTKNVTDQEITIYNESGKIVKTLILPLEEKVTDLIVNEKGLYLCGSLNNLLEIETMTRFTLPKSIMIGDDKFDYLKTNDGIIIYQHKSSYLDQYIFVDSSTELDDLLDGIITQSSLTLSDESLFIRVIPHSKQIIYFSHVSDYLKMYKYTISSRAKSARSVR